jgi:transposase-like protein
VIEQREEFIADRLKKEWNVRELCRRYEIAPKTGYKWMKRFVEEGKQGLRDQRRERGHPSSAPLGHLKEVNQVRCTDLKGW